VTTRIAEHRETMPQAEDWEAIDREIIKLEKERDKIQDQMQSTNGIEEGKQKQMDSLNRTISELSSKKYDIADKANTSERLRIAAMNRGRDNLQESLNALLNGEISDKRRQHEIAADYLRRLNNDLQTEKRYIEEKTSEWQRANSQDFKPGECLICPIYGHNCSDDSATKKHTNKEEEARSAFNTRKAEALKRINNEGSQHVAKSKEIEEAIKVAKEAVELALGQLNTSRAKAVEIEKTLSATPAVIYKPIDPQSLEEYNQVEQQIEGLKNAIEALKTADDKTEIQAMKQRFSEITTEIQDLSNQLNLRETIKGKIQRIEELDKQRSEIAQAMSDMERDDETLNQFARAIDEELDRRINGRFRFVKFRLSKPNIGDGEEVVCDTLVDGVPYGSVNNEAKINAGIDIINALQEYHDVKAPIWIDNRESVNEIEPTTAQLINLRVSWDQEIKIDYSQN
jgi:DNA repair protein SbcC/Rad50